MIDPAYEALANANALTEVRVVHDYLQFIFEPYTLSVYAPVEIHEGHRALKLRDIGYYDAICFLIGQTLTAVVRERSRRLQFTFSGGIDLFVSMRGEDATCPEAAILSRAGEVIMVEGYEE